MRGSFVCVALLAMAACDVAEFARVAQQTTKEQPLTPQQFVTFASTTNLAEIDMAKMALKSSTNPDVQKFAERNDSRPHYAQ